MTARAVYVKGSTPFSWPIVIFSFTVNSMFCECELYRCAVVIERPEKCFISLSCCYCRLLYYDLVFCVVYLRCFAKYT